MTTYSNGYHCPKCNRRLHNPRRKPPKCCGRVMVNDFDPRLVVKPATCTLAAFKAALQVRPAAPEAGEAG